LQYTKYSCEKVPSSEPKFSQDSLSSNYAVLPLCYAPAWGCGGGAPLITIMNAMEQKCKRQTAQIVQDFAN
jgi:hypothetical protein